jgi:hypothetical protein
MKRVVRYIIISVPPVRLYLDDLRYLLEKLGPDYELTAEGYEYSSLDELLKNTNVDHLTALSISISKDESDDYALLSVDIGPRGVSISTRELLEEKAVFAGHYLRQRSPWYLWTDPQLVSPWGALVLAVVNLAAILAALVALLTIPGGDVVRIVGAIVAWLCVSAFGNLDVFRIRSTRIALYTKDSKPTLWQRKREDWVFEVIKIVATAALGIVIGRMIK